MTKRDSDEALSSAAASPPKKSGQPPRELGPPRVLDRSASPIGGAGDAAPPAAAKAAPRCASDATTTLDAVLWRGARERLVIARDSATAEAAAAEMLADDDDNHDDAGGRQRAAVGLDTEWSASRDVAVLQLAARTCCLVCLLPEVDLRACPSLQKLLADVRWVKAGVGIGQDARMLEKCGVPQIRGCLDLFLLAARERLVSSSQPCGLAFLAKTLVGEELCKDDGVRRSDWSQRPLSDAHLIYAARDALAGRDAAEALRSRSEEEGGRRCASLGEWCAELLDRTPKLKASSAGSKRKHQSAQAQPPNCPSYCSVKKFGQTRIVDSRGRLMLHMGSKTCEALLRRGLATVKRADDGEEDVVELHFSPDDNYDYAGLDATQRNACVGCSAEGVARYYVVPKVFWEHMPTKVKSYNCHDIQMLCPRCRARAEAPQAARVQELLAQHGARRAGSAYANANALSPTQMAAKKAAGALLRPPRRGKGAFPARKLDEFRRVVADEIGISTEAIERKHLERAFGFGSGPLPSERICRAACADEASLRSFLKMWRELFVSSCRPRFLAEGWGVETGLADGRFVPSVPNAVQWPGDWFCGRCGVHCFGRTTKCRSCGTAHDPRQDAVIEAPS